jgi:hypothetical protein
MRLEFYPQADGVTWTVRATWHGRSAVATRPSRLAAIRAATLDLIEGIS